MVYAKFRSQRTYHSARIRISVKINDEYRDYKELPPSLLAQQGTVGPARPKEHQKAITAGRRSYNSCLPLIIVSHSLSHSRHIPHDSIRRLDSRPETVNTYLLVNPLSSTRLAQNYAHNQADLPRTLEACPRHLWAPGVGTECRSRARQSVVCHWSWRQGD
jgi:hypothetical protein